MKSKFLMRFFIGLTFSGMILINDYDSLYCKPNSIRVVSDNTPNIKDKFDNFWTPENEIYLNNVQKSKIDSLRIKVNSGQYLTLQEKKSLSEIKKEVIKVKLGEQKFKELEDLIKKRETLEELISEERLRLYELNKEATIN